MKCKKALLLFCCAVFLLQGCALVNKGKFPFLNKRGPVAGIYHRVQKKETLWGICRAYGVSMQDVAELNNIKNISQIQAGDRIFIPGAKKAKILTTKQPARRTPPEKIYSRPGLFIWPVWGRVIEEYGIYGGIKHDGIRIKAAPGTPVKAAKHGTVVFSGFLEGYGNTIILEHPKNYVTVYANNRKNVVRQGQRVTTGQKIGEVGVSPAPQPTAYLHFQIRRDNKTRNPRFYLPGAH